MIGDMERWTKQNRVNSVRSVGSKGSVAILYRILRFGATESAILSEDLKVIKRSGHVAI